MSTKDQQARLDVLFEGVKSYRSSENFQKMLTFCGKMKQIGPYNAMLVYIQRPGATYLLTETKWAKEFDCGILPNARPVLVLIPFGPLEYLFDISDTFPLNKNPKLTKKFGPLTEYLKQPFATTGQFCRKYLEQVICNFSAHGMAFNPNFVAGSNYGAQLRLLREESHPLVFQNKNFYLEYPAHYLISINSHAGDGETMASILHELGHFFCHHLISPPGQKEWWQSRNLPHNVMEFEAESVAWLICQRIGLQSPSERYLSGYLNANKEIPAGVSIEAIFKAADNVWKMVSTIITYDKGLLYKHDKRFKEKLKTVIDSHKNSKQTQKPQSLFD